MSVTLSELLARPFDPRNYLITPLLPKGGTLVIGGPPKHMKSLLTLDISYDLAEGLPVLGDFRVSRALSVLYMEQEMGEWRMQRRGASLHATKNGGVAPFNLHIVSRNWDMQLDTNYGADLFMQEVEQAKPDILVLDPYIMFHSQNENDNTQMASLFRRIKQMTKDIGLIIVHHTTKPSEYRDPTNPNSLRGAGLFAQADSVIMLEKPVHNMDNLIRLHYTLRDEAPPYPQSLVFSQETHLFERSNRR